MASDERVTPTTLAFAGDWHGFGDWGVDAITAVGAAGVQTMHHVGDFGIWPGEHGEHYLAQIEDAVGAAGIELFITPGNHEDWDQLDELYAGGPGPRPVAERIWMLPRGYRWEWGGRSFVSLGGAPTLSFERRTVGVDFWPGEEVTEEHVAEVAAGGHADVFISHDAPNGGTDEAAAMIADNPFGFSARAQAYAEVGRDRITRAFEAVRPALFAHGHYHVYGVADRTFGTGSAAWTTRFLALDRERRAGNTVLVDVADYSIRAVPGLVVPAGGFVPPPFMR